MSVKKFIIELSLTCDYVSEKAPTVSRVAEYVSDALQSWAGSLEPPNEDNDWTGDSMWGDVSVKNLKIRIKI
jgi:hypothetical protein